MDRRLGGPHQPPQVTPGEATALDVSHFEHTTFPGLPLVMADATDTTTSTAKSEQASYEPKPTLQYASAVGIQAAGVGALVSAVQNALGSHTAGAAGFLTRTGGTIGFFGSYQSYVSS